MHISLYSLELIFRLTHYYLITGFLSDQYHWKKVLTFALKDASADAHLSLLTEIYFQIDSLTITWLPALFQININ